jgi:hypothetical protein
MKGFLLFIGYKSVLHHEIADFIHELKEDVHIHDSIEESINLPDQTYINTVFPSP